MGCAFAVCPATVLGADLKSIPSSSLTVDLPTLVHFCSSAFDFEVKRSSIDRKKVVSVVLIPVVLSESSLGPWSGDDVAVSDFSGETAGLGLVFIFRTREETPSVTPDATPAAAALTLGVIF